MGTALIAIESGRISPPLENVGPYLRDRGGNQASPNDWIMSESIGIASGSKAENVGQLRGER